MAMFGRSQRAVFKPSVYQPGKRSRRMPRWLFTLLIGMGLGAGGLLFLQANYGPQRLTIEQSEQLRSELSAANLERQRLRVALDETTKERDDSQARHEQAAAELAQERASIQDERSALQMFIDAAPADPRGGEIGVSWAEFRNNAGALQYRVLLMPAKPDMPEFKGNIVLSIAGVQNRRNQTIESEPIPVTLGRYSQTQNSLALPEDFRPRIVTIRVLDPDQKQRAMRIFYVR